MTLIRLATARDGADVAAIYAPIVRETSISFEIDPPDASWMSRHIETTLERYPWLVCEREGRVVGYAYSSAHRARAAYRWSVEASVYIGADDRGRGVGRALYPPLFDILALQGFYVVHAGITLPNAASVGLHEALGFEAVGVYRAVGYKFGAWHDVGWWRKELGARPQVPSEPVALPDLAPRERVEELLAAASASLGG